MLLTILEQIRGSRKRFFVLVWCNLGDMAMCFTLRYALQHIKISS